MKGNRISAMSAAISLNRMYATASRLAVVLAPMAAKAELVAVPMFCPMISAKPCSSPIAPASKADRVRAIAAVDDCITAVMISPATTSDSRPATPGSQPTPSAPRTAGRSNGCNCSARPAMPRWSQVRP